MTIQAQIMTREKKSFIYQGKSRKCLRITCADQSGMIHAIALTHHEANFRQKLEQIEVIHLCF